MEYSERLYKIAFRKTYSHDIALDIVLETFLVAAEKVDILYSHPNKLGWLYKTMYYKLSNYYKQNHIRTKSIGFQGESIEELVYIETEFDKIEDDDFDKYKDVLKPRELDYIKLKFRDCISTKEIARNLNISYTNATTLWYEIKKKLKKFIKK